MGIFSSPTCEPGLAATSSNATFLPPSDPAPSSLAPSTPAAGSSSGTIQPHTIVAIVFGLVGFVVLILATAFISRFPCRRRSKGVPLTPPRPRLQAQHVELTTVTPSMLAHTARRSQPDHNISYLPPYEPRPPPYSESEAAQHAPQHPRAPERATLEA